MREPGWIAVAAGSSFAIEARRVIATVGAVAAMIAIGWIDHVTGPDLGFSLFYLIPIAWVAWGYGRVSGTLVALAAAAIWFGVDVMSVPRRSPAVSVWNGLSRLCIFTLVGLLLSALRDERVRLQGMNERLRDQNRDLDAFAGRVAHDLRSALSPITMAPPLLRRAAADAERVLTIADRTERCALKVAAMIDALLAFARTTSISSDQPGPLLPTVTEVLDELSALVARVGATVEVDEIPDVYLRLDAGLLHIVLANVMGNAVKYLDDQPERRVRISGQIDGSFCRIAVEDTGPGIPAHDRDRIFEPFFRVEGTRPPGTGIGLATVQRVLSACGGRIEVDSVVGRGSRFRIWVPLADRRHVGVPTGTPRTQIPEIPARAG
jgi:signal transduction histidine kinase